MLASLLLHANEFVSRDAPDRRALGGITAADRHEGRQRLRLEAAKDAHAQRPRPDRDRRGRLSARASSPRAWTRRTCSGCSRDARDRVAAGEPERATELFREALALWRGPTLAGLPLRVAGAHRGGAVRRAAAGRVDGPDRLRPRARSARAGARRGESARAGASAAGTAARAADARPVPRGPASGGARRIRRGAPHARRRPRHRTERGAATATAGDPPPRPVPRDAGGHCSSERTRAECGCAAADTGYRRATRREPLTAAVPSSPLAACRRRACRPHGRGGDRHSPHRRLARRRMSFRTASSGSILAAASRRWWYP